MLNPGRNHIARPGPAGPDSMGSMAKHHESYDVSVLYRSLAYLEDGRELAWVPTTELPRWAVSRRAVYMGNAHHPDGPIQLVDGPWFGMRVVQLITTADGRRWRFATLRLPARSQPPVRSIAHRFARPVTRLGRRSRSTLRQAAV